MSTECYDIIILKKLIHPLKIRIENSKLDHTYSKLCSTFLSNFIKFLKFFEAISNFIWSAIIHSARYTVKSLNNFTGYFAFNVQPFKSGTALESVTGDFLVKRSSRADFFVIWRDTKLLRQSAHE